MIELSLGESRRFVLLDAKYRVDRVGTAFTEMDDKEDAGDPGFSTTLELTLPEKPAHGTRILRVNGARG